MLFCFVSSLGRETVSGREPGLSKACVDCNLSIHSSNSTDFGISVQQMVSEQFDHGRMEISNVSSQSQSIEDLEYVEAKLEKIQEHFGSINKYMQTIMKKLEKLTRLQDDNLKKTNQDVSYSSRGRNTVIQNEQFDIGRKPDPNPDPYWNSKPNPDSCPDPKPSPDPYLDPNSSLDPYPDPNPRPDPDSKMDPKSDPNLNPKLNLNFESGMTMDAHGEGEHSDVKGDDERKEKKEENRRKITGERDEDRSDENLGRPISLLPISLSSLSRASPPSPPPSLPSKPPSSSFLQSPTPLLLPLSQFSPSLDHTKATKKEGTQFEREAERLVKPNLGNLLWALWPNTYADVLFWPKPGLNLMRQLIFATYMVVMVTINSPGGVSDDLWKPPQPRLPPLPWPPPTSTPQLLPQPVILDTKSWNRLFHFFPP